MEPKEKLIKTIVEELNRIPDKYLATIYEMIHNFRKEISSDEIDADKRGSHEWIDEIKKVQEQSGQIRPDQFGNHNVT